MADNNPLLEKFVSFMKEKRTALGLTQTDLAFEVYNNRQKRNYINDIESGRRKGLTIETMNKILTVLQSDINFIEY